MEWSDYIVQSNILIPLVILSFLRSENRRWVKRINAGEYGSWIPASLIVMATSIFGGLIWIAAYGAILWYLGWRVLLGTLAVSVLIGVGAALTIGSLLRPVRSFAEAISTLAIWPVSIWLALQIYQTLMI